MLFAGLLKKPVKVTFQEEGQGRVVATWRMPLDKLPEAFLPDTRLEMGGQHYVIVRARPATRTLAAEAREVTVVIRAARRPG